MSANSQDPVNLGINVMHCRHPSGKGGVTIAWSREVPHGHMIRVSTAYCSKYDTFTKKIGTQLAVDKMLHGISMDVPVFDKSHWAVQDHLRAMFYMVPFHGH